MTLDELEKKVRKEQRKKAAKQKKKKTALWLAAGLFLLASGLVFLWARQKGLLGPGGNKGAEAVHLGTAPEDGFFARIDVIDVGQGSATLIQSDGEAMLIDGGGSASSSRTVAYLKECGVTRLKYIVATHFDADHLYGAVGALEALGADTVLLPDYTADTAVCAAFMRHLEAKAGETEALRPRPGDGFQLGKCSFTVLAPCSDSYEAENDYSLALRFSDGVHSLLVTGDAERVSEAEMTANSKGKRRLASDIYIVGHHGSQSSSTAAFLREVGPDYAIISCGAGNDYGHPKEAVLNRLKNMRVSLWRTDRQGDIVFYFTNSGVILFEQAPCNDYTPGQGKEKP